MRVLLDTQAFLWWIADSGRLSREAHRTIADPVNGILVSAASAWEIATGYRIGRLPGAGAVALDVAGAVAAQGFEPLPISVGDAERAGRLPVLRRNPFERMLAAQALARDLAVVSANAALDHYRVRRIW